MTFTIDDLRDDEPLYIQVEKAPVATLCNEKIKSILEFSSDPMLPLSLYAYMESQDQPGFNEEDLLVILKLNKTQKNMERLVNALDVLKKVNYLR